jgi:hypothetical protein
MNNLNLVDKIYLNELKQTHKDSVNLLHDHLDKSPHEHERLINLIKYNLLHVDDINKKNNINQNIQ